MQMYANLRHTVQMQIFRKLLKIHATERPELNQIKGCVGGTREEKRDFIVWQKEETTDVKQIKLLVDFRVVCSDGTDDNVIKSV